MNAMALVRSHARRATAFVGVGALNTAIDFSAFACLNQLVGLDPAPSNVLAFLIAVANSYIMNALITFADRRSQHPVRSFARFLVVAVTAMAVSTLIVHFLSMLMHPLIAKLIAVVASTLINYIGACWFVFSGESSDGQRASVLSK